MRTVILLRSGVYRSPPSWHTCLIVLQPASRIRYEYNTNGYNYIRPIDGNANKTDRRAPYTSGDA